MDFFEYAALVSSIDVVATYIWLPFVVGGLCFAIVYVFQAVGLFTLAKNNGYGNRWMAFVPFFNTYYIGKLGEKNRLMGINTRILAIVTAVFEFLLVIAYTVYYIGFITALGEGYVIISETVNGLTTITQAAEVPVNMAWTVFCSIYLGDALTYINLVYELLFMVVLMCFFQTYAASRYVIFTITSIILPIQGILIFVIMNNKGMNYREYILKLRQQQYQAYQQQYRQQGGGGYNNPYNNPYQGGNVRPPESGTYADPYSGENTTPTPQPKTEVEDPFDGLGASPKPKDPFDLEN